MMAFAPLICHFFPAWHSIPLGFHESDLKTKIKIQQINNNKKIMIKMIMMIILKIFQQVPRQATEAR